MSKRVTVISGREKSTFGYPPSQDRYYQPRKDDFNYDFDTEPAPQGRKVVTVTKTENKTPIWVWIIITILVILLIVAIILWFTKSGGSDGGIGSSCNADDECATGLFCTNNICQASSCSLPPSPLNLTVTAFGNSQINGTWSSATNTDSYIMYASTKPNFTIPDDVAGADSTTQLQGSITGLTPGQLYFVKVSSVNSCGVGNPTSEQIITLPSFPNNVPIKFNADFQANSFLKVAGSNVQVENSCNDDTCSWIFDDTTGELRTVTDTTLCLVDNSGNAEVFLCSSALDDVKKWKFDDTERNICLISDSNKCIFIANTGDPDSNVSVGNPAIQPDQATSWNINL